MDLLKRIFNKEPVVFTSLLTSLFALGRMVMDDPAGFASFLEHALHSVEFGGVTGLVGRQFVTPVVGPDEDFE